MRYPTIRDLDEAGLELRIWCFRCARGVDIGSQIWARFEKKSWSIDMIEARARFTCKVCRSADQVILLPATAEMVPVKQRSWADEVAGFFHATRSAHKKGRW